MTGSFGIKDRLLLEAALPQKGNILTMRIINDLRDKLLFTAEQAEALGLKSTEGRVSWTTDTQVEMQFSDTETSVIRTALKTLNDDKALTAEHIPLWDKFGIDER